MFKKKSRKNIIIGIIVIMITITLALSITYALWSRSHEQTTLNLVETGCFNVGFEEESPAINLVNAFPITDAQGLASEPYSFKLTNNCSITAEYVVKLEITDQTTMPLNRIKVALDDVRSSLNANLTGTSTLKKAGVVIRDTYIIYNGFLGEDEEVRHELRKWIDYFATKEETENKKIESYITIEAVASDEVVSKNLKNAILAQFGGADSITEAPVGTFENISDENDALMYKIEDDYGTSYYYRGAKDLLNNNLIFAEHQWKMIRINGDNSVRLIYNGICPNNECTINSTGGATQMQNGVYFEWSVERDDAKYVGYMYGGANGIASTSREQAVINETSSNAKIELENWYSTNIESKGYGGYISDTLFCNDRMTRGEAGGLADATNVGFESWSTDYAANYRIHTNKMPALLCGNKNDRFTVGDTIIGNGALTYPVGLITVDEASLAGGTTAINKHYYLYNGLNNWSFSPRNFISGTAVPWLVYNDGRLGNPFINGVNGLRPTLNLKSNVKVTGGGSESNPYVVV